MRRKEGLFEKCEPNLNNTATYTFMNLTNKEVFMIFFGIGLSYQLDFGLPLIGVPFHMLFGVFATVAAVVFFKKWKYGKPRGWVEGELYRLGVQNFKGVSLLPPVKDMKYLYFK